MNISDIMELIGTLSNNDKMELLADIISDTVSRRASVTRYSSVERAAMTRIVANIQGVFGIEY